MECQDDSDNMSNVSVSLCHTPYEEIPPVLNVQNEDSASQIVTAVTDHNCNGSKEQPVSSSQHEDFYHVAAEPPEQQGT